MTSSEAKRLWRRSIKEHLDAHVFTVEKLMNYTNLLWIVHPRTFGGEDITSNLVPKGKKCNQAKGSSHWMSWMRHTFGINRLRETLILSHIN